MNNNEQMEFDRGFADLINEGIPGMFTYFTRCIAVGFKRHEAFELTRDVFTRLNITTENDKESNNFNGKE